MKDGNVEVCFLIFHPFFVILAVNYVKESFLFIRFKCRALVGVFAILPNDAGS